MDFEGFSTSTKAFGVLRCRDCDSLFLDPQPTLEDTRQFYAADYMAKAPVGWAFEAMVGFWDGLAARGFVKRLGRGAVLDYGCGDGSFVRRLRSAGCARVAGYDPMCQPDPEALIFDDLEAIAASGERFDVIRMHNSIEHLAAVDATMTRLRGLLKPDGCVFGETANGAHVSAKWFGAYWGYLHYPYHTVIFSPKGLALAARRWGFANAETLDTLTPGAWAFTMEHVAKRGFRIQRRGHLPVYPLLLLASAVPVLLDRLLPGRTTGMAFRLSPA